MEVSQDLMLLVSMEYQSPLVSLPISCIVQHDPVKVGHCNVVTFWCHDKLLTGTNKMYNNVHPHSLNDSRILPSSNKSEYCRFKQHVN